MFARQVATGAYAKWPNFDDRIRELERRLREGFPYRAYDRVTFEDRQHARSLAFSRDAE